MSTDLADRAELLAALAGEFRELSAATVMFHQAVADRLGMNITDHKCADILARTGPISAGELARWTGLTTGAITGVIDRLERAGLVRRAADPDDRRRVMIEPILKRIERVIGPLFESMARAAADLCATYSTQELAVIRDFTARAHQMAYDETRKLREGAASTVKARGRKAGQTKATKRSSRIAPDSSKRRPSR
jgi:DNA-binding MarR family transcriptional regulator